MLSPYQPVIAYEPLEHFVGFHQAAALESRDLQIVAAVGGYGSGKSYCGAAEALNLSFQNAPVPTIVVVPSYTQGRDSTFKTVKEILELSGYTEGKDFRSYWGQDHKIRVMGRAGVRWPKELHAELVFFSAEKADYMKGINAGAAWVDEFDKVSEFSGPGRERIIDIIEARVRVLSARRRILLTGTPEGIGWGYRYLTDDTRADIVHVFRANTLDNVYLPKSYHDNLKKSFSARAQKMYLEGMFINLMGDGAYTFDKTSNVGHCQYDPKLPIYFSLDFNRSPGIHFLAGQIHYDPRITGDRQLRIFREWYIESGGTLEAADTINTFLLEMNHKQRVMLGGDPSGHQKRSNYALNDFEVLHSRLAAWQPDMVANLSHNTQSVSVDLVNTALEHKSVLIDPSCKTLTIDLEEVRWRTSSQYPELKLDKSDMRRTHMSDALRYLVEVVFPTGSYSDPKASPVAMSGGDRDRIRRAQVG